MGSEINSSFADRDIDKRLQDANRGKKKPGMVCLNIAKRNKWGIYNE